MRRGDVILKYYDTKTLKMFNIPVDKSFYTLFTQTLNGFSAICNKLQTEYCTPDYIFRLNISLNI